MLPKAVLVPTPGGGTIPYNCGDIRKSSSDSNAYDATVLTTKVKMHTRSYTVVTAVFMLDNSVSEKIMLDKKTFNRSEQYVHGLLGYIHGPNIQSVRTKYRQCECAFLR